MITNKDIDELIDRVARQKKYPPAADHRLRYVDGYNFGLLVAVEVIKQWAGVEDGNT